MLFKQRLSPKRIKVKEAFAARAIYVAGGDELNKVSLTFTADDGTRTEFEIPLTEVGKLITQLKVSYNAALPKHHSNIH